MIRTNRTWRVAAATVAAGLSLAACGTTDDSKDTSSSGDGGSDCKPATIAFLGPKTGDYANLGINIVNGAKVALDAYNADNADCEVTLKEFDSQGDPEKATPLAVQIINDDSIIGVVGPTFSGESDATGEAFNEAGLVTVSPSATNPDLTTHGWTTFHRILGNDATQAPAAAKYIKETLGSSKVFVVDDASEYGKGIADGVADDLGDLVVDRDTVQQKQTDFGPTVTKVKASGADSLWYGGYYPEAGLFVKQLRAAGWTGTFLSGDGTKDTGFVESAGKDAAEGAILTCPCAPATDDFTTQYQKVAGGEDPGTYSTEGYDAANLLLNGIKAGSTDRAAMLDFVNNYDEDGLTKHIKFDETGEVSDIVIYAYTVTDGDISSAEPIE
jgi:branched-chain amino acid transport system substrate-binding protein